MKKIVNIISLMLILSMLVASMSACFGGNDSNPPEENQGGDNDNIGNNDGNNTDNSTEKEEPTTYFTGKQSVLLIGQSNMAGRGFAEDVEPISDDRITMLDQSNQWVKMQEPIHYDKSAAGVGLAASFAKAFVETFDTELGLIPAAMGGSSISDWEVGGTYYNDAIERAKAAQKDSEICAILWHQGESNRSNHSGYADKLQTILDAMIAELGLDRDKVIIITGELREISTNPSQRETFHAELNKLNDVYKNYGVADADGLTLNSDIIHFDAPSLRVFGYRYFDIFKTLVTGEGYEFVNDPTHYYVGVDKDPNPNNNGKLDIPSENSGEDFGNKDEVTGTRVEIEGNIVADTYLASGSSADKNREDQTYLGTNKNASRPLIMYNLALILSEPAVEQYRESAKVEFTFTITEGADILSSVTTASVYGFLPGDGVSNADFTTLTWNNCKDGAPLHRGAATYVFKDKALSTVNVIKEGNKITYILDYTDIEQFICTEPGDNYGIMVMGFDFGVAGIKFASMENTDYPIPTVNFVYYV